MNEIMVLVTDDNGDDTILRYVNTKNLARQHKSKSKQREYGDYITGNLTAAAYLKERSQKQVNAGDLSAFVRLGWIKPVRKVKATGAYVFSRESLDSLIEKIN